jgi:uncharacterized protein YjbI with pentapeptide repeats
MKRRTVAVLGIATLCVFLMGSGVYGFNQDDLEKLRTTRSCTKCDLSRVTLNGADLSGVSLMGADLTGANIKGVDLNGANLNGADLMGANLNEADLTQANLMGANLYGVDLTQVKLNDTMLDSATWTDGQTCKPGSRGQCIK